MGCVSANPEKKYLPNNDITNPNTSHPIVAIPAPDLASADPINNTLNVHNLAERSVHN
jgi:hypothetical protein